MELTKKQNDVLKTFIKEKPKITILSGAKRAGKTHVAIIMFMMHVAKYENENLSFIIGGATQASIKRNVLDDMEMLSGKELKIDKSNAINLFGNKIYCFDGANSDAWKKARGFTSAGALLNEGTALHDSFVKEVISRCSYTGAQIIIDTNPENPIHSVKTDYIDKDGQRLSNNRLNIKAFHFDIYDNEFLDQEYVESIVASTPSGMFTDRDIYGKWVSAQGVVYKDFNKDKHYIKDYNPKEVIRYFAGVDWGYDHHGSIVVVAKLKDDSYVIVEEHARRHKEIDYWVDVAKDVKKRYGDIMFYADSARPEHVDRFKREKIKAYNANKEVLSGIETVSKLFKENRLKVVYSNVDVFKNEIFLYSWQTNKDEPVKQHDDVLDALRYAIHTELNKPSLRASKRL